MIRPTSFGATDAQPVPERPHTRRRPVSEEVYVRPIADLLERPSRPVRTPTAPVVRFREPEVVDTPKSTATDEEPSVYDSDASHTSSVAQRRRKRFSAPRKGTTYLLAKPAPKLGSKKQLLKHVRPRLLLQLQELPADQRRPRPTIDVFPASLIAGPLVTARYINRFPRIFGAKGELGPRDLILVKSEDYDTSLSESEDDDEHVSGRREPVAVLSPVRGLDCDEIVLDDGTVWTARSNKKGGFDFVHVDKHGLLLTARWVKRSAPKLPSSRPTSPVPSHVHLATSGPSPADPNDYRYTFSILNPLSRRHPILATLTPHSFEVYDDYTTVSSSQGRYPPIRIVNHDVDSSSKTTKSPLHSPSLTAAADREPPSMRQTHLVDEATKKLIMVSGLWLSLRLDGRTTTTTTTTTMPDAAAEGPGGAGSGGEDASYAKEPFMCMQSRADVAKMPRRQTTCNARSSSTPSLPPAQSGSLRRAMSTGAAFMQRRMRQSQSHSHSHPQASEAGGSNEGSDYLHHNHHHKHNHKHNHNHNHNHNGTGAGAEAPVLETDEMGPVVRGAENRETGDGQQRQQRRKGVTIVDPGCTSTPAAPAPAHASAPAAVQQQQDKQQKQSRRVSWLKKLKH